MKKFYILLLALMLAINIQVFAVDYDPPIWYGNSTANTSELVTRAALDRAADSTRAKTIRDTLATIKSDAADAKASSAVAVSNTARDTVLGISWRTADSTQLASNATAIAALPTTTHISNLALQVTTVDAIVDTILNGNVHLFTKASISQTATTTDSLAVFTVNGGGVEILSMYVQVTTQFEAVTDSVYFLIDYPAGYTARLDCGDEYNAAAVGTKFAVASETAGTATTKTLAGVPYKIPQLNLFLDSTSAMKLIDEGAGTGGVMKVVVKYRSLEAGARLD